jgi:isopropylmalate/homocitrate/citramalate synthase
MGAGVGPTAVKVKLAELGLEVAEDRIDPIVDEIRGLAQEKLGLVTDAEFREVVERSATVGAA